MGRLSDWDKLAPTVLGWGILDVDYKVFIQEELPKVGGKRSRKKCGCALITLIGGE